MGSSLAQTPDSVIPQTAAPATQGSRGGAPDASPDSTDAPSDTSADDSSSDDGAPTVSGTHAPSAHPAQHASNPPAARAPVAQSAGTRYACRHPAADGYLACDAIVQGAAARGASCNRSAPYCASDLQAAYGLAQASRGAGRGATVAIVAAYGYPDAAGDLAVYRRSMGLPACAASSGCFKIVNQRGRANALPKPSADSGDDWRPEAALDLDMASAICPNCKLLLVQANSDKSSDLASAVNAAAAMGAAAIANGYGGGEQRASDSAYRHPGRAITASAGDAAGGVQMPCAYASVVCVGGTSLTATGRGWSERVWHDVANGCSALVAKPSWQHGTNCKTRAVPDVAAVADPATGVAVYESASGGWLKMGGTGASASIVAALFALGPVAARSNAPQWTWRRGASHRVADVKRGF